jgi:hypothetical protein
MKYKLTLDSYRKLWYRLYYEVEAESLEEAVKKIDDAEAVPYDGDWIYESELPYKGQYPEEPVEEISEGDKVLLRKLANDTVLVRKSTDDTEEFVNIDGTSN